MSKRRQSGKAQSVRILLLVGCAAVAVAVVAQTTVRPSRRPLTEVTPARRARKAAVETTLPVPAARRPLTYYTGGVRGGLFSAAAVEAVKPKPPAVPVVPPAPVVVDPFVDYAYTGTVGSGDQLMALVENSKTKEGQFLKIGDPMIGGAVTTISDRSVTVTVAGKPHTLFKSDEFKLTPLDKSAPYMTAQPSGQGAPGQMAPGVPGGMPAPMAGGMFPGMERLPQEVQDRIRSRFQGMTPEQMSQMRNRFMNRQFEGGMGRRGRRGGGE